MANDGPLVSIILPTYNRSALLPRAIDSVISQTCADWELIIWDDGSTDNTAEIVGSYNDERLRYFRDDNHGVAYARNRAIDAARGEYIAFLDSDDEWNARKLQVQVDVLTGWAVIDVLFTDYLNTNASRDDKHRGFEQNSHAISLLEVAPAEGDLVVINGGLLEGLAVEDFIALPTVLARRVALQKSGYFNEALRNFEDCDLWWRMGLAGVCFAYLSEVYMTRHKPPGSLSSLSFVGVESRLRGLDLCADAARACSREDLIPCLRGQYRNAWQSMILLQARNGNRREAFGAFSKSMEYGFRLGSARLLLQAFVTSARRNGQKGG